MTKSQEISAKEWREQFAQGDHPDHGVAENIMDRIAHGHSNQSHGQGRKGLRGIGQHGPRQPRKEKPAKLVGDIPGSHILENRDVRDPIIDFLRVNGWFCWKNWQGPYSYPGVPDITAIRDEVVFQIECKRPEGKFRKGQVEFKESWMAHGGRWMVARSVEDVEFMAKGEAQENG